MLAKASSRVLSLKKLIKGFVGSKSGVPVSHLLYLHCSRLLWLLFLLPAGFSHVVYMHSFLVPVNVGQLSRVRVNLRALHWCEVR